MGLVSTYQLTNNANQFFFRISNFYQQNSTVFTIQAPRGRASALEFVVRMHDFESVRSLRLIPHRLLTPVKKDTSHWQALSRVEMVRQLLIRHGRVSSYLLFKSF